MLGLLLLLHEQEAFHRADLDKTKGLVHEKRKVRPHSPSLVLLLPSFSLLSLFLCFLP